MAAPAKTYIARKQRFNDFRDFNTDGILGAAFRTKRKPSPRKLEPREVVAMLKARKEAR